MDVVRTSGVLFIMPGMRKIGIYDRIGFLGNIVVCVLGKKLGMLEGSHR